MQSQINEQKYEKLIYATVTELCAYINKPIPGLYDLRTYLNDILTVNNDVLPENLNNKIDQLLQYELSMEKITLSKHMLKHPKYNISLWQGDITLLDTDVIVNAANTNGLGCYKVGHRCIDNIIHNKAGPRMRQECNTILKGRELAVGEPIITLGYNLLTRHVIHVPGPIYNIKNHKKCEIKLSVTYLNCLNKTKDILKNSIAIPCISTGEFRYPNRDAAIIAIATTKKWLDLNNNMVHVIFNVFTDEDRQIYKELLNIML
jgi:O-acetyl-ADP-ribose deacetylase (regulator of RNase III)